MSEIVIEKDYYLTMILRLLSQKLPFVVFKGGTSLSKCHKIIRRFSEDIDITIDTSLSQGQKKKVKYTLVEIAEELGMDISNLEKTRSRRDYNRYEMGYESVFSMGHTINYIGEVMIEEAPEMIGGCHIEPFEMKVQGLDCALADKVKECRDTKLEVKTWKIIRSQPIVHM